MTSGSEVWQSKKWTQDMLKMTEMDLWQRLARIFRRECIRNDQMNMAKGSWAFKRQSCIAP